MNSQEHDCMINTKIDNLEICHETVESVFNLSSCEGRIKDILNLSSEISIIKKYIFKAPLVVDGMLTYGYKIKLMLNLTYNCEYTEESALGETKFLSKNKLFNITIVLPENYEEGMNVAVTPTIIDNSYNLINCKTLYLTTYISFNAII